MMRRPGPSSSRLRTADQPPEWRATFGPEKPATGAGAPLPCFLSNQRLINPEFLCSLAEGILQGRDEATFLVAAGCGSVGAVRHPCGPLSQVYFTAKQCVIFNRSEERRVGKECRSRWS